MKCISLWQPYATLIAIDAKRIETRGRPWSYRGPLAIHAAMKWTPELANTAIDSPFRETLEASGLKITGATESECRRGWGMPFGEIVATCRMVECLPIVRSTFPKNTRCVGLCDDGIARIWNPSEMAGHPLHVGDIQECEHEAAFGDYTPGRWAWILTDIIKLARPIPYRGHQGPFEVPDELILEALKTA